MDEIKKYLSGGDLRSIAGVEQLIPLIKTQKEFAERLKVSQAQVSRDEKNEYHGITVEKAQRILETFGIRFEAEIEEPISAPREDDDHLMYA